MAEKGRLMIIEVEDSPGSLTYTQFAGGRAKDLDIGNPITNTSDDQSPNQWQEGETGYGLKSLSFGFSGIFENHATLKRAVADVVNSTNKRNMRMTVPGLGVFLGPMAWPQVRLGAGHENELSFSSSFQSAGEIAYTPSA